MKVLAVNCGSSTLKFAVYEPELEKAEQGRIAEGLVERIGDEAAVRFTSGGGEREGPRSADAPDHGAAARLVLDWLASRGIEPAAAGHRVVHGGDRFVEPTVVDGPVAEAIESLSELAPLHNGPALAAIHAARDTLGPDVPMVAAFDTAFHRTMPPRSARYAIAGELAERHAVYRYGFHGLAHRCMMERYAGTSGRPVEGLRLITLQLGAGCSVTAIDGGRSIDTSMGFTPLEGLVMGTRSGDIDPSVVAYLASREGMAPDSVVERLNEGSGLLGVSGRSADMRDLLAAERSGDERASLAVEMFCYRARKYIGAYLAALGSADAVVFGGGIGEHSAEVRARICDPLAALGLRLDAERNAALTEGEGIVSEEGSPMAAHVVRVDEERIIAADTYALLSASSRSRA